MFQFSIPYQQIGQTFLSIHDKNFATISSTAFEMNMKGLKNKKTLEFHPQEYRENKWCHDTPGTVSDDQIINQLTQEEILKVMPSLPMVPRSLNIHVGNSLLIGT